MSRRAHGILPLLFLALGIGGTAAAQDTQVDEPINPADARILWRWVAIDNNPEQPCPGAEGWTASRLFEDPQQPLPPGLARYCLYEVETGMVTGGKLAALRALVPGALSAVEPDQMVVSAEAEGQLPSLLFRILSEHFMEQAGQSVAPLSFPTDGDAVRLTFLDTQPTGLDPELFTDYNSAHGYTLATLTERLLCNGVGGECAADVRSRLTLGNVCFNPRREIPNCRNAVNGGWFGSQVDLAVAIRNEVVDWLESTSPGPPPGEQQHLILNLSVGWNSRFGSNQPPNTLPLAAATVYSALQDASCRGALVIAAAGNQHGGPMEPGGPMFPAGWEARPAPPRGQCIAQLIEGGAYVPPWAFPPPGDPDTRSLVVAAGGVQFDNGVIHNGRPEGEPPLVAFADHAATESLAVNNTPTVTLTGTSVATAVVSAAAALGWRFDNGLRTPALLTAIATSATDLGRGADFCRGGTRGNPCPSPVPNVQRVALCATVECVRDGNCTGPYASCPELTALDLSDVPLNITPSVDFSSITQLLEVPECGPIDTFYDPTEPPPDNPCLTEQFHGVNALPWVDPQPGDLPCPNCFVQLSSPGTLYYEIDPQLLETFTDITLQCGEEAYALPLVSLSSSDLGAVAEVECPQATPVQLLMRDSNGRTHINPVLYLDDAVTP